MSPRSTLDPDVGLVTAEVRPPGHDIGSIGPSDSSDTGSDSVGPGGYDPVILGSDSDAAGTGVDPSSAERTGEEPGGDIGFDRVVGAGEAGLGGGLDQAEEARSGVTDAVPDSLDPLDPLDPLELADDDGPLDPDGGGSPAAVRARMARGDDIERGDAAVSELPDAVGDEAWDVERPDDTGEGDTNDGGRDADDPDAH